MQSRHGSTSPVQASKSNHSIECSSPLSEADSSNGSNSSTMDDSDVDQVDVVEI